MPKLFHPDSPILSFLSDALDFIVLNLLALLCALPVVTAGASFSALAGVMTSFTQEQTPLRARDFFSRFRGVFLRATLSWVIFLALSALFLMNLRIAITMPATLRLVMLGGLLFFPLCMALTATVFFPMLSFAGQTALPALWKRAFLLSIAKLPRTLPLVAMHAVPLLLLIFLPRVFVALSPVWLCAWLSLCAFLCAKLCGRWYAA